MKTNADYWGLFKTNPLITCYIFYHDLLVYKSTERGITPLLNYYRFYESRYNDLIIADKIVGKGAVVLSIILHAKKIYTPVISVIALEYAKRNNIDVCYKSVVPTIRNREKNGNCPIEKSVQNIENPTEALKAMKNTLLKLKKGEWYEI